MLPTEQPRFFELVTQALAAFGKYPEQRDLEAWWRECKGLSLEGLEAALKSHRDDPDRGERAPRPVDITRRMKSGSADAQRCAARDHTGQCEYRGIFCEATNGEGLWFCPWHRQDHAGPEASLWIERSREIPWDVASGKRIQRMLAEAVRARPVVDLAHTIALRHGAKPWQSGLRLPFNGELSTDEERMLEQGSLDNRDVA